jgi:glycosyltransferase involved in cell wall biosynthesis
MPSVSEPFGLTAIESLQCGTPILISKQTGVGESLTHCLKVDFWDTNEMAAKILAVLRYKELGEVLSEHGRTEAGKFSWDKSADQCINLYNTVLK